MNNLLKDFKIQPTKLRGENMEIKQKALDGVNEITQDTKTGITTTTLVHTFKPCIDLFDGNEYIAHYETDTEFIEDFKRMKQELTNLKAIEKEHQRMNGELREEIKELKEVNTYSKRNLFKMNKERLEANLKLVNENERLKKHLEVPETCNLKTLIDYADYYKDLDKAQILADTYIDYCAYVNLAHRYSELETQLKELKKSNGINDWQRQVNLKNYMDTIHIIDELEEWLNDLGNWVVLEKLQELKGENDEK